MESATTSSPSLVAHPSATSSAQLKQYSEDDLPEFLPMPWTMKEIRDAIPSHLFIRDTARSLSYLARDLAMAAALWKAATWIDPYFKNPDTLVLLTPLGAQCARWSIWGIYFWLQGLVFTGIWVIGHECGHGAFSPHKVVNDSVGFIVHTLLWTPYFSWKISHHRHHCNHASMERDEVYVPKTRSDLALPPRGSPETDYDDFFGDTPIYTLLMLVRQQLLAFPAYLLWNVSGQKHYPKWTNHFNPNSVLFTKCQRNAVIISDIGIAAMIWGVGCAISLWGLPAVVKYYLVPWLAVSNWFIMITYLHHTDPDLPHYRNGAWNFQRGAAATVDRPFLGWQGRFFLHDVAHYHVIHHFFPKMPFYHGAEATEYLKAFIGDHYCYSDKPVFKAVWRSYTRCQFVEDEGDILFYRDRRGRASRRSSPKDIVLRSASSSIHLQ